MSEDTLSFAVIPTVVSPVDVDPVDLAEPLFDAINFDALNRLFKEKWLARISSGTD